MIMITIITKQVIKALAEAEAHPGPSLVIAYAPCAMQAGAWREGRAAKAMLPGPGGQGWAAHGSYLERPAPPPPHTHTHTQTPPFSRVQGMVEGMAESGKDAKLAVESGYWPLYRYLVGAGWGGGYMNVCGGEPRCPCQGERWNQCTARLSAIRQVEPHF